MIEKRHNFVGGQTWGKNSNSTYKVGFLQGLLCNSAKDQLFNDYQHLLKTKMQFLSRMKRNPSKVGRILYKTFIVATMMEKSTAHCASFVYAFPQHFESFCKTGLERSRKCLFEQTFDGFVNPDRSFEARRGSQLCCQFQL